MKQLKKTLLTLVALLAVTTGAWATDFTSLKVGDVIHVGDVINTSTNYTVNGTFLDANFQPATLVRGNISTGNITESETGDYYFLKNKNGFYSGAIVDDEEGDYVGGYWPVTDTSDGISVTAINPDPNLPAYTALTFAVHEASAASGPKVAWDKAAKTGSFTMPGGNVTLEPEYYPQAALAAAPTAINDVPATTDGAIVKAGTVKNIGETTTAQGTVMYYVSTTALDDAALLALAADQWTADVPTAKSLAEGQAYVYYYVRGNDGDTDETTFSDGDILAANALTVTIADAPTYAVTFAEGTDLKEWTADPAANVTKGTPVTVTYTGSKKVIGVKAEKKAAAPSLNITNPVVGQVIGSDGKNYAYASLPTGVTAVAKICYVSGSGGLALALTDEESYMNWSTAQTTCAAHTPAITGGTWKLATKDEWNNMINAADSYDALRDGFSSVDGTNMKEDYPYWSSTEDGSDKAWCYFFGYGLWDQNNKNLVGYVRACLAF